MAPKKAKSIEEGDKTVTFLLTLKVLSKTQFKSELKKALLKSLKLKMIILKSPN